MTLEPLDALSRLAARRFASFADAANAVLDLLAGAVPGGCVLLGQVDWDAGECRVLDARGGAVERGSALPLSGSADGAGLIGPDALAEVCPGAWVTAPLDAADGSVVALLVASPGRGRGAAALPGPATARGGAHPVLRVGEHLDPRGAAPARRGGPRPRAHRAGDRSPQSRGAARCARARVGAEPARQRRDATWSSRTCTTTTPWPSSTAQALADLILKDVAEVFTGAVRRADHLAQIAADALAIVLVGCKGDEGARAFVGRVERSLERVASARPAPARLSYGIEALAEAGSAAEAVRAGGGGRACRRAVLGRVARGGRVSAEPAAAGPVVAAGGLSGPGVSPPSLERRRPPLPERHPGRARLRRPGRGRAGRRGRAASRA